MPISGLDATDYEVRGLHRSPTSLLLILKTSQGDQVFRLTKAMAQQLAASLVTGVSATLEGPPTRN